MMNSLKNAHREPWSRMLFCISCVVAFVLVSFFASAQCFLSTVGQQVRNQAGQNVILRAANLGYWLNQEGYMMNPQNANIAGCQWKMKKIYFNAGQSEAQVESFYQSWRDNFITKADIDYIASLGFNAVRLPMHYELFLTSAQRSWRNNVIKDISYHDTYKANLQNALNNNQLFTDPNVEGFKVIDRLLSYCAANGMYVILDLHAAPGGQGADQNIADLFYSNDLWNQQVFKDVTNKLWSQISTRYKGEGRIAWYELVNEPNQTPSNQVIHDLYQRLITTIRGQADNHIIMIEGNGWGNNYDYMEPFTFSPNWGLIYNVHRYGINPSDDWVRDPNPNQINRMGNLTDFRTKYNVPIFVGETGENSASWMSQNITTMEQNGLGWAHWTYKRHDTGENAALLRIGGSYPTDGVSVMASVLESIKFANNIKNTNTISAVTGRNPAPWTTGCYNTTSTCSNATAKSISSNIQAEDYCEMAGIQTETTGDTGGGLDVGYIDANDWLGYRVSIPSAGTYKVSYRVASQSGGGNIRLETLGGSPSYGTIAVPSTGGWQTWTTISHNVTLSAGTQSFALVAVAGGFNLNWINITPVSSSFSTTIQAESYTSMSGVQLETTTDTGGGQDVGYIDANDWMTYPAVSIPSAGTYTVQYRVASQSGGGNVRLEAAGGGAVYGSMAVPSTGGWQTWTTISQNVTLPAGSVSFGIKAVAGGFNINWFAIKSVGGREAAIDENNVFTDEANVSVFPNPSTGSVTIRVSQPSTVNILDLSGKSVMNSHVEESVTVDHLNTGLYIIKAFNKAKTSATKLIVK
jgi:endoglucanase